ncbi:MAG: hypothetical protein HY858_01665 [Candidatus Solibacter usitatus]|nr:hypothetical protein [Candidatus Solibacter usitatus]
MRLGLLTSALALGFSLASCGGLPRRALIPVPPETLDGGWKRIGLETPPLERAPEELRALKPRRWVRTSYTRPGAIVRVDFYAMGSQASAFEARQKWRNEPGAITLQEGNVLAVCSSETEPLKQLIEFARKLENAWPPAR